MATTMDTDETIQNEMETLSEEQLSYAASDVLLRLADAAVSRPDGSVRSGSMRPKRAGVVQSSPRVPMRRCLLVGRWLAHEPAYGGNEMTIHKLRAALIASLAGLAALAAFAASAMAYEPVEHTTITTYQHLVPGNSGWEPIVLKGGLTD